MITFLLKRAYSTDVELWTENGKLKYRATTGTLSEDAKQDLITNKESLIRRLEQNNTAKIDGWMIFEFGEMYCKPLRSTSGLYIFRNDDETLTMWRGNWRLGESTPFKESTIVSNVSFQEAMDRAKSYMNWSYGKTKKTSQGGNKTW